MSLSLKGSEEMTFEEINERLKKWADDRNISEYSDKQVMKLIEELGELSEAINKNLRDQEIDSVGDILVVMIILCYQRGLDPIDCLNKAYNVIKDRTGKTVNGTFIKSEDL